MLKYIVIELCNTSTSYCHYNNDCRVPELISLDNLKAAIMFAMKQNLNIQFVYPDYQLPLEYNDVIESIDHIKIKSSEAINTEDADIIVFNGMRSTDDFIWTPDHVHILRVTKSELSELPSLFEKVKYKTVRLNVVLTDVEFFSNTDYDLYEKALDELGTSVEKFISENKDIQINLLTDRIVLEKMNNCNAGCEAIAVAPNGKFYVCPAFYHQDSEDFCGDVISGLDIKNPQLFRLDHAPICRHCDAFQCKRCVWLNRKMTLEVNTPSHQQCVISHLERNASRNIIENLKRGGFETKVDISKIDFLDPFEVREKWQ